MLALQAEGSCSGKVLGVVTGDFDDMDEFDALDVRIVGDGAR